MHDDNVEEVCSSCVATTVVNIQYCAVLAIAQARKRKARYCIIALIIYYFLIDSSPTVEQDTCERAYG